MRPEWRKMGPKGAKGPKDERARAQRLAQAQRLARSRPAGRPGGGLGPDVTSTGKRVMVIRTTRALMKTRMII